MIQYLLTRGHLYTLGDLIKAPRAPRIHLLTYDQLIWSRRLPRATYIFTDLDRLAYSDLELAAKLYRRLKEAGMRVLNDPAQVKKRYSLLRALYKSGINTFNVYPAEELSDEIRYPVFVRRMQGHAEPCTDLLNSRGELERHLTSLSERGFNLETLIVVEFVGEPIRPGLYRKLSVFRMGEEMVPSTCVHERNWLVKRGAMGAATEELYQEELRIVRENPYAEALRSAFALARIDYGRADFGFYNSRIEVFEINTNPHIPAPGEHSFATRRESMQLGWEKIIEGFRTLDSPPGPSVLLPKDPGFRPHRKWTRAFMQTRLVE